MSYGIGIVILKEDLEKQQIRYDFCDWTLPITVKVYPDDCKKDFKQYWYSSFKDETKLTTLKKLINAPCDCVCIIDENGNFETLKNRTPISGKNIDIKTYLKINNKITKKK